MNLTKREKRLIMILIIFAVLAFYYQYIIYPELLKINELKSTFTSLEKKYGDVVNGIDASKLNNSIKEYKNQLAYYNEYIPEYLNIENFIPELYKDAKIAGLKIQLVQFDQGQSNAKQNSTSSKIFKEYPIVIDAQGSYVNIDNFIMMLQDSKRLVTIKGVSLSRSQDYINAVIYVSIYYRKDSFASSQKVKQSSRVDPFKPLLPLPQDKTSQQNNNLSQSQQGVNNEIANQLNETLNNLINNIGKK